jgi:hypothetical protein
MLAASRADAPSQPPGPEKFYPMVERISTSSSMLAQEESSGPIRARLPPMLRTTGAYQGSQPQSAKVKFVGCAARACAIVCYCVKAVWWSVVAKHESTWEGGRRDRGWGGGVGGGSQIIFFTSTSLSQLSLRHSAHSTMHHIYLGRTLS